MVGFLYAQVLGLGDDWRADHYQDRIDLHRRLDGFARARRRSEDGQGFVESRCRCAVRRDPRHLHLQGQAICRVQRGRQSAADAEDQRPSRRLRVAVMTGLRGLLLGCVAGFLASSAALANDTDFQPGLTGDWNGARTDLKNEGWQFQVKGVFEGAWNP